MFSRTLILVLLLALFLHVMLGWVGVLIAAVVGGYLLGAGGWLVSSLGVFCAWGGLILWNYVVAPREVQAMEQVVGSLLGNLPEFGVVSLSLAIGFMLGALGGLIGTQVRLIVGQLQQR